MDSGLPVGNGFPSEIKPACQLSFLILLKAVCSAAQFAVATNAPLYVSDDGLGPLIHMHMLDPDSLRAAVPQPA